jgi:hypothetical protein
MKFASEWLYADPEKAARKLLDIANETEAIQDGRIQPMKITPPFGGRLPKNHMAHPIQPRGFQKSR